jgi:hypothetical protein
MYLAVETNAGSIDMNWPDLTARIHEAADEAFSLLAQRHPDEDFYVFALYTDSSAMTALASTNSTQALDRIIRAAGSLSESSRRARAWYNPEWGYPSLKGEKFSVISKIMRDDPDRSIDFSEFEKKCHRSMIEALRRMDSEGRFGVGDKRATMTIFITISDDDRAYRLENSSARMLNPPVVCERFLNRYGPA